MKEQQAKKATRKKQSKPVELKITKKDLKAARRIMESESVKAIKKAQSGNARAFCIEDVSRETGKLLALPMLSNYYKQETSMALLAFEINKQRTKLGLSLHKVAEKSNTSFIFVSKLERGMLDSVQLAKLRDVLHALNMGLALIPFEIAIP